MRIVCPACDATYDVPDAMLDAGGRAVRCARCAHEWVPAPNPAAPLPPEEPDLGPDIAFEYASAPPDPAAAAADEPDSHGRHEPRLNPLRPRLETRIGMPPPPDPPPPAPRRRAGAIVAWALSIVLLVAAGTAAVAWRTQVMAAWPPSERVFAALGLG